MFIRQFRQYLAAFGARFAVRQGQLNQLTAAEQRHGLERINQLLPLKLVVDSQRLALIKSLFAGLLADQLNAFQFLLWLVTKNQVKGLQAFVELLAESVGINLHAGLSGFGWRGST